MNNIQGIIKQVRETPLVMARFFEKPKCKPWDLVKGRRLYCCHGLGEHMRWCLVDGNIRWEQINFSQLTAMEIIDA